MQISAPPSVDRSTFTFPTPASSASSDFKTPTSATTPSSANSPAPASSPFDLQLLDALLNGAQGGGLQPGPTASGGPMTLSQTAPGQTGAGPTAHFAIGSTAGALDPGAIASQSSQALASDLTSGFGTGQDLTLADVDQALGLNGATPATQDAVQKMRADVQSTWDYLSGGSGSLSSQQLAAAIQQYVKTQAG